VGQVFGFCNTHQFKVFEKKIRDFSHTIGFRYLKKIQNQKNCWVWKKKQQIRFKETSVLGISQNFKKFARFHERIDKGFPSCISQLHAVLSSTGLEP
jgi:hypothetical protein